jgi:hypothetical protein
MVGEQEEEYKNGLMRAGVEESEINRQWLEQVEANKINAIPQIEAFINNNMSGSNFESIASNSNYSISNIQ